MKRHIKFIALFNILALCGADFSFAQKKPSATTPRDAIMGLWDDANHRTRPKPIKGGLKLDSKSITKMATDKQTGKHSFITAEYKLEGGETLSLSMEVGQLDVRIIKQDLRSGRITENARVSRAYLAGRGSVPGQGPQGIGANLTDGHTVNPINRRPMPTDKAGIKARAEQNAALRAKAVAAKNRVTKSTVELTAPEKIDLASTLITFEALEDATPANRTHIQTSGKSFLQWLNTSATHRGRDFKVATGKDHSGNAFTGTTLGPGRGRVLVRNDRKELDFFHLPGGTVGIVVDGFIRHEGKTPVARTNVVVVVKYEDIKIKVIPKPTETGSRVGTRTGGQHASVVTPKGKSCGKVALMIPPPTGGKKPEPALQFSQLDLKGLNIRNGQVTYKHSDGTQTVANAQPGTEAGTYNVAYTPPQSTTGEPMTSAVLVANPLAIGVMATAAYIGDVTSQQTAVAGDTTGTTVSFQPVTGDAPMSTALGGALQNNPESVTYNSLSDTHQDFTSNTNTNFNVSAAAGTLQIASTGPVQEAQEAPMSLVMYDNVQVSPAGNVASVPPYETLTAYSTLSLPPLSSNQAATNFSVARVDVSQGVRIAAANNSTVLKANQFAVDTSSSYYSGTVITSDSGELIDIRLLCELLGKPFAVWDEEAKDECTLAISTGAI